MMNFAEWPVVDVAEFEFVELDVTRWGDTEGEYEYTVVMNFYRSVGENDEPNTGFTLCTHIAGLSLAELHSKIALMVEAGLFDGTEVQALGTLYDEDHVELETIDWNSFESDEGGIEVVEVPRLVEHVSTKTGELEGLDVTDLGLIHRAPSRLQ